MTNRILGRRWMLAGVLAFTAGTAGLAGAGPAQGGHGMAGMHMMHMMHGMHGDPAAMDAHVDAMLTTMVPDATDEQKARLKAAAKGIHADMAALHAQFDQSHQRLHALLLAPAIDRGALEAVRAEQIRQMDQVSRRMVDEMAAAAEVLTPAQRRGIAEKLKADKG